MEPKDLEHAIRRLLSEDWPDDHLRTKLEALAEQEENFNGFTWLWGPILYRRNRVLFRPFILAHFGQFIRRSRLRFETVAWKGAPSQSLEPWLTEVDQRDDLELFRRLYEWKLTALGTGLVRDARLKVILPDLLRRFRAAPTRSARAIVLQKFALWFELDEPTALELYRTDPLTAGPFILRHLPSPWLDKNRALWRQLLAAADTHRDEKFRWDLYRRQVPLTVWETDVRALCTRERDPAELHRLLEQHHPAGHGRSIGACFLRQLEQRGRDVFPYITRHLGAVRYGVFSAGDYGKLLELARARGWWDLWAAIIRVCANPKDFNREITRLLDDTSLPRDEVLRRLAGLSGVSRELNFPGFGLALVHQLDESTALGLLEKFPDLLRGPYLAHLQVSPWAGSFAKLIAELIRRSEDDLLDHVAARIATRVSNRYNSKNRDMLADAERLADHYAALKSDETRFSRRAASVLTRIPAFAIYNYNQLIRDNRLARLLFERSASAYLADARSLRDLVEGSEIHVQALAYRALGLRDERAPALAVENLSLLLGTLFRPLQRPTRTLALRALANAATTPENAARILTKAREALDLPDDHYPKETLLGLIASLLTRWPALRGPREEPVVYRRPAA